MTFKKTADNAMSIWFGAELADTVTLNGTDVSAHALPAETRRDADSRQDHLDVEFRVDDYPAVAFRTDTLVHGGLTWRNPVVLTQDTYTKIVRFSRNQRAVARPR